jgi:hypothetical protein
VRRTTLSRALPDASSVAAGLPSKGRASGAGFGGVATHTSGTVSGSGVRLQHGLNRLARFGEGEPGAVQSSSCLVIAFIPVLLRAFPPLRRGGAGGVAAGTPDIVNGFPILRNGAIRGAAGKRAPWKNPCLIVPGSPP